MNHSLNNVGKPCVEKILDFSGDKSQIWPGLIMSQDSRFIVISILLFKDIVEARIGVQVLIYYQYPTGSNILILISKFYFFTTHFRSYSLLVSIIILTHYSGSCSGTPFPRILFESILGHFTWCHCWIARYIALFLQTNNNRPNSNFLG